MRRAVAATLAALAAAPVATAASIVGSSGADVLRGTAKADVLDGRTGKDTLLGLGGADFLVGGPGRDRILAGPGDDRVKSEDGAVDSVACGPGIDTVNADPVDVVAADCEVVARRISRDTLSAETPGQRETEVEPDTFAFGSTVVAVFQVGRNVTGGAGAIGYAVSTDAGRTWRSGLLPGQTLFSPAPGTNLFASDPSVAYDAAHGTWLAATLFGSSTGTGIAVARSPDGASWSAPADVATTAGAITGYDKEWIACDNAVSSRFRGRCYLAYDELQRFGGRLAVVSSDDGGVTWSPPVTATTGADGVGAQPVTLPDGRLVVSFLEGEEQPVAISAVTSGDGGSTFGPRVKVAAVAFAHPSDLRATALPSADVDAGGRVVVAWPDCRFRAACSGNDVVLATSLDGVTWSPPTAVPGGPGSRLVPGLAAGPGGRLAVVSYGGRPLTCTAGCSLDAWLTTSADGGETWSRPKLISAQPMQTDWLAATVQGRMLGDYLSVSFVGSRVVTALPLASPPGPNGSFAEAMYAVAAGA
jgi:hypothetical protein